MKLLFTEIRKAVDFGGQSKVEYLPHCLGIPPGYVNGDLEKPVK